eukprot:15366916-Ditylum_brightwellii.AAC.1
MPPDTFHSYPARFMYVGQNEVQIREIDRIHRIETNVTYFSLPEEDFGALVRRTTITNLDQQQSLELSVLDGLARIEPAGGQLNELLKNMGRTLEAWMGVYQASNDGNITMPYYKMSTETADTAAVKIQHAGHYCLAFVEDHTHSTSSSSSQLLPIVYDTSKVFGNDTMMLYPVAMNTKTVREIIGEEQYGFAETSSAFAAVDKVTIEPGKSITIASFYGLADHITDVPTISHRITANGFVQYKFSRAREIIQQINNNAETSTKNDLFNGLVSQMFMDNSIRGGIPIILGEENDDDRMSSVDENNRLKVYHLFSRIHGGVERDYNDFEIVPTFFSQGPGNFRDMAQNRRIDVIFNPHIGSFNVKMFLSLIQADGYNPLSVESVTFTIKDKQICDDIAAEAIGRAEKAQAQREALSNILHQGPFRPGQLFELMKEQLITPLVDRHTFINRVAAAADVSPMGIYKTGFWSDHWTYIMDLLESYLLIHPDGEEHLLFDQLLPYFFSPASVRPRSEKYVLSLNVNGDGYHIRQLDATVDDAQKKEYMELFMNNCTGWYDECANWQHADDGTRFQSSPIAKLLLLASLKFASRDAFGMGIEYEAGRPGWNDALNGLVGMVGSGMPETYELDYMLRYIKSVLDKYNRPVILPVELSDLINQITMALDVLAENEGDGVLNEAVSEQVNITLVPSALFDYWDTVATAREYYREQTRVIFSGMTKEWPAAEISVILSRWINEVERGIERAMIIGYHVGDNSTGSSGLTPTYFSYNITKWERTGNRNEEGHALVLPLEMEVKRTPLFLEGPARMMKTATKEKVRKIYNNVKESDLRDEELKMYKISASLKGQSYDMGRVTVFPAGWLENESIWVHLSYKFYLELIRKGLYKEFYEELTSGGMFPFMNPSVYGRSPMECTSFIASSAFTDPSKQGRGYLPRLSGTTAEFLSMWALMMIGPEPFYVNQTTNMLHMQLVPAVPLWFFQGDDTSAKIKKTLTISFNLFSSINVTYHNSLGTDLFGISPNRYEVGLRDGSILRINGSVLPTDIAVSIRQVVLINTIDAYF